LELFDELLLDWHELRLAAHHRTGSCLSAELVQASCMEIVLAVYALEGIHEDGLAEGAEEVAADSIGVVR